MCLSIGCHGYCPSSPPRPCPRSLRREHLCVRSGRQTDGALRCDGWHSGFPSGVGETLSDPVSKKTTQLSLLCVHVFHPPYVCFRLSLAHSHLSPLCHPDIIKWSPGARESAAIRGMGRQTAGRLTDGQEVRRPSAEMSAAGRNKSNNLS